MQRTANPRTPVRFRPRPPYFAVRPGGETGRRKGLKIPRGQPRVGSIPTPGTICVSTSVSRTAKCPRAARARWARTGHLRGTCVISAEGGDDLEDPFFVFRLNAG